MRVLRDWTSTGLVAGFLLVGSGPAHASCTDDSGPRGSDVVFVGVPEEERRGRVLEALAHLLAHAAAVLRPG